MSLENLAVKAERWRAVVGCARASGVISRDRLGDLGYSRSMIRTLVNNGRLVAAGSGVYYLPGAEAEWRTKLAILAFTRKGRVSHLSAAMLHGLGNPQDLSPGYAEIVVAPNRKPHLGEREHAYRTAGFDSYEGTLINEIPTTSALETLLDIGATHEFEVFRSCANAAFRMRLANPAALVAKHESQTWRRKGHRKASEAIRRLLADNTPLSDWSSSAADLCVAHGLPRPLLEFQIRDEYGGWVAQVDLYWPQALLVVELDGMEHHANAWQMAKDRERDAALARLGITVLRFTWSQYMQSNYFTDTVAAVFDRRVA